MKKSETKPVKKTKVDEHSILAIDPAELTRERLATLEGQQVSFYFGGWRGCRVRKIKFNRKGKVRLVRFQLAGETPVDGDYYRGEKRNLSPWGFFHNHPSCGVISEGKVIPFLTWFGQASGELGRGDGTMAGYSARFSRRDAGGYDASFGKGSKKLLAVITEEGGLWTVTDGFGKGLVTASKKLGDVKVDWGNKAGASYGGVPSTPTVPGSLPPRIAPPRIGPPRIGPPSIKPPVKEEPAPGCMGDPDAPGPKAPKPYDGPTCPECKAPIHGWHGGKPPCRCKAPNTETYTPDPLDPKMYTGQAMTAHGALDMVAAWMRRNPDYIKTEGVLDPTWAAVREVLARDLEYPEYRLEVYQ